MEKKINSATIKIIAMITMLIDHFGKIMEGFIPGYLYMGMRMLGRIAFPLFAFGIVEGFIHTSNIKKYVLRVGFFALLSEIPYDIFVKSKVISFEQCNVLVTFFIALLVLCVCKKMQNKGNFGMVVSGITGMSAMIFSFFIHSDYSYKGIALIILFYYTYNWEYIRYIFGSVILWIDGQIETVVSPISFFIIHFYNGEKGKINKWICYFFYPVHLLILGVVGGVINV